ncbi:MAG: site-2 protease family protein, partial [Clostridia bacterium]
LHEWAHAWVALKNGDLTAKLQGRLTLNPRAHFDPIGLLMFVFVGFGWAKPVPINSSNFENKKVGIFTTAIAGVIMNFVVAFLSFGILCLLLLIPEQAVLNSTIFTVIYKLLYYFFYISVMLNGSLIAFNILPIYPLDGFRVVESFTKPTNGYVKFMYHYGSFILLGVLIISSFLPAQWDIFSLYFSAVQNLINKIFQAIWGTIFVGVGF